MTLDTADEPTDKKVERHATWAELFFDLVAVAGVPALAHVLGMFGLSVVALRASVLG